MTDIIKHSRDSTRDSKGRYVKGWRGVPAAILEKEKKEREKIAIKTLPKPLVDFINEYREKLLATTITDDFIEGFVTDLRGASVADRMAFIRYLLPPFVLPEPAKTQSSELDEAIKYVSGKYRNGHDSRLPS